jgi:murein DD-endopeptidase MepM/ murein hydrolase activator NlpD
MILRRLRSLLDLALAALCLWAAWYHTPAGALVRGAGARLFGIRTSARPLLAYYSAGTQGAQPPEIIVPRPPLSPSAALGAGASAALAHLPVAERERILAGAHVHSASPSGLTERMARLANGHGSRAAGVLAFFCGDEAAQFATARAGAGAPPEELARELPPTYERCIALTGETLTLGTAYALAWPVPPSAPVTSAFGVRRHPILGGRRLHAGIDLGVPAGTEVRAAAAGIVRRASEDAVSGLALVIDHGSGVTTAYLHNAELRVRKGDRVSQNQVVARSGNSGRSTGPHLHYQLDLPGGPVDPLRFRTAKPQHDERGGTDL